MVGAGIPESTIRRFFERTLLTPAHTRGTVYRGTTETGGIPNAAIDILENRHIIRGEWRGGSRWYELTHDRFIEPILASNKNWLEKNVGTREIYNLLERKADEWTETGQEPAALLNEYDLKRAENWLERPESASIDVSDLVRNYVSTSRKALDAETIQRERGLARRYRRVLLLFMLLLVPAAIIWFQAIDKSKQAQEDTDRAEAMVDSLLKVASDAEIKANGARIEADLARAGADEIVRIAKAREDSALFQLRNLNARIDSANMQLTDAQEGLNEAMRMREEAEEYAKEATKTATEALDARVRANSERQQAVEKLNQALALAIADMSRRQLRLGEDSLAALLAKQAYVFDQEGNNQFGGQVYEALRTSLNGLSADSTTQLGGPQTYFDHRGQVRHVVYSPDGNWLVSGADDDYVRVRNLQTNRAFNLGNTRLSVRCLAFSPNSEVLAVCDGRGDLKLWAFTEEGPSLTPYRTLPFVAQDVAFDNDGEVLAMVTREGWLYRWSLNNTGDNVETYIHPEPVFRSLAASEHLPYLAASDRDGTLYVWNNWTTTSDLIIEQAGEQRINALAFSPTEPTLVSGGEDYRLMVWRVEEENPRLSMQYELLGHLGPINDLAFSKNGRLLASASSDKSIHIRNTADLTRRPLILQDHDFWVWSADFHPNNQRLASGSGDGTVRVWITTSDELVDKICQVLPGGALTQQEWETYIGNDFDINQYQKPCP